MIKHLSPSALNLLQMCGEAYRRKYIEGQKTTKGTAAAIGIATHKSAEVDLTSKKMDGILLPDEAIPDIASDSFELAWAADDLELSKEEKQDKEGTRAKAKDQTLGLAQLHHGDLAPELVPEHLEHRMEIKLDGLPFSLMGYADVIEVDGTIRDLKTRGKTPKASDASEDLGLAWYSRLLHVDEGVLPPSLMLDVLVKTKTPKRATVMTTPNGDHSALLQRIERAAAVIEAGAFLPAQPGHWKCSEKFCEFYDDCVFGRRARVSI